LRFLPIFPLTDGCQQSLYDEQQSSMDELGGFEPSDATGFIQIEAIRIKKWVQSYHSTTSQRAQSLISSGGPRPTFAKGKLGSLPRMCMEVVSNAHELTLDCY
jgi:hypothetical protein